MLCRLSYVTAQLESGSTPWLPAGFKDFLWDFMARLQPLSVTPDDR
jgi:hypothetical protein